MGCGVLEILDVPFTPILHHSNTPTIIPLYLRSTSDLPRYEACVIEGDDVS